MSKKNIVESITMEDEEEEKVSNEQNSLQDTIKELGNQAFKENPKKLTVLSNDNISGLIQAECLNEYMECQFGIRYPVLDELIRNKRDYSVSHTGFGLNKLIELLRSIQASFEQTALPPRIRDLIGR